MKWSKYLKDYISALWQHSWAVAGAPIYTVIAWLLEQLGHDVSVDSVTGLRLLVAGIMVAQFLAWRDMRFQKISLEEKLEDPKSAKNILGRRAYSETDKKIISDMFRELRALIDSEIRATELECQTLVINIWKISYINSLEERANKVKQALDEKQSNLDDIQKRHISQKHIFDGIVGTDKPSKLMMVRQQIERCMEPIRSAQRIHSSVTNKDNDFSSLLSVVSDEIREKSAKLNDWMEQALIRITLVEAELGER